MSLHLASGGGGAGRTPLTPPSRPATGLDMGSAVQDNYRKYPNAIVTVPLRCIATVLLTAIGSHASKCTAK